MQRVLVIANNLQQASYRLRIAAMIPLLAGRGAELAVKIRPRGLFARRRLLATAAEFDSVILQRKMLDPWDASLLRKKARRIFYDIDDALMFPQRPGSNFSRWRIDRRFRATTEIADHVIAGNEFLADIFRERHKPVTIIPTVVDPGSYNLKQHVQSDRPTLVWIGSHSTLPYVKEYLPAIEAAGKLIKGLRLLVIADQTLKSTLDVQFVKWSADREADALTRGDIGIAPTPQNTWTQGKCGFKIVQYMAAGLPTIASPVGANAQIVRQGETGYLPKTPDEWTSSIVHLARDVDLRTKMGAAARERAEQQYSLQKTVDQWARLLIPDRAAVAS